MAVDSAGIDALVERSVFAAEEGDRQDSRRRITEMALAQGVAPASIQGLYEAAGKGLYRGVTVPAINIRGLTYHVARAVFRRSRAEYASSRASKAVSRPRWSIR